ncbi:uncharacterized protein LOC122264706 [Penaeus japonicus]|uniref:uncharacterized protein LOC122264706 n=1 Tax=Penaeus japonicus TaxID=27405 RepID=UPI001C711747|nr:uncharacterized protein LOC122264706 [Penaeus japonicus]
MVKLLTLPFLIATVIVMSSISDVTSAAVDRHLAELPVEGSSGPARPSDSRSYLLAPFRPYDDHARRRRSASPLAKTEARRGSHSSTSSSSSRTSRRYFRHSRPGLFF